jgi:hypothetical protein
MTTQEKFIEVLRKYGESWKDSKSDDEYLDYVHLIETSKKCAILCLNEKLEIVLKVEGEQSEKYLEIQKEINELLI